MRFRWKLMILLTMIGLVPIVATRFIGTQGVRVLGDDLVARSRQNLNQKTKGQLKFVVEAYSRLLAQNREALDIALLYQATEIEGLLAQDKSEATHVLFAEDFNANRNLPRDFDTALLYDPRADTFVELTGDGLPLGVTENPPFEQQRRKICPGQIIVIGTDGIWETHNASGDMFGKENLQQVIRSNAELSAGAIIDKITGALDKFRHPLKTRADDITMVVIKVIETTE